MAEKTMIEMDPAQFAKAMAARVVRERRRIAQRIEEHAAGVVGDKAAANALYALAEEIREGTVTANPEIVPTPPDQQFNPILADNDPGDGLPSIREHDDVAEGIALVQGGRFRSGVTGRLRPVEFPTD